LQRLFCCVMVFWKGFLGQISYIIINYMNFFKNSDNKDLHPDRSAGYYCPQRPANIMSKKALYRHKRSGDLFAIETDENGKVLSTSGPLLTKDLNPEQLDYDNYWNPDINAHIEGFELLSQAEYKKLLKRTGFYIQESQRSIFSELERRKD